MDRGLLVWPSSDEAPLFPPQTAFFGADEPLVCCGPTPFDRGEDMTGGSDTWFEGDAATLSDMA